MYTVSRVSGSVSASEDEDGSAGRFGAGAPGRCGAGRFDDVPGRDDDDAAVASKEGDPAGGGNT